MHIARWQQCIGPGTTWRSKEQAQVNLVGGNCQCCSNGITIVINYTLVITRGMFGSKVTECKRGQNNYQYHGDDIVLCCLTLWGAARSVLWSEERAVMGHVKSAS